MLNLNDIDFFDDNRYLGKKSLNLAELKDFDFNIPDSYVIFEKELKNINKLQIPFEKVAVRSAALGEDDSTASFAGIFKSKLNITKENYLEAIKEVNESFYSRKAEVYQKLKKVSIEPQILVQKMIESKYSMVIFIKDRKITFSLIEGSCEKIVSGKYISKEFNFEIKKMKSFFNKFNRQNQEFKELNLKEFFDKFLLIDLIKHPNDYISLDIETTFDGNKWWILQLRELNI